MSEEGRPRVAAEVRAWISVGVGMVVQFAVAVWWVATFSADVKAELRVLRESVDQLKENRELVPVRAQLADHEARLRDLERGRGPAGGR